MISNTAPTSPSHFWGPRIYIRRSCGDDTSTTARSHVEVVVLVHAPRDPDPVTTHLDFDPSVALPPLPPRKPAYRPPVMKREARALRPRVPPPAPAAWPTSCRHFQARRG